MGEETTSTEKVNLPNTRFKKAQEYGWIRSQQYLEILIEIYKQDFCEKNGAPPTEENLKKVPLSDLFYNDVRQQIEGDIQTVRNIASEVIQEKGLNTKLERITEGELISIGREAAATYEGHNLEAEEFKSILEKVLEGRFPKKGLLLDRLRVISKKKKQATAETTPAPELSTTERLEKRVNKYATRGEIPSVYSNPEVLRYFIRTEEGITTERLLEHDDETLKNVLKFYGDSQVEAAGSEEAFLEKVVSGAKKQDLKETTQTVLSRAQARIKRESGTEPAQNYQKIFRKKAEERASENMQVEAYLEEEVQTYFIRHVGRPLEEVCNLTQNEFDELLSNIWKNYRRGFETDKDAIKAIEKELGLEEETSPTEPIVQEQPQTSSLMDITQIVPDMSEDTLKSWHNVYRMKDPNLSDQEINAMVTADYFRTRSMGAEAGKAAAEQALAVMTNNPLVQELINNMKALPAAIRSGFQELATAQQQTNQGIQNLTTAQQATTTELQTLNTTQTAISGQINQQTTAIGQQTTVAQNVATQVSQQTTAVGQQTQAIQEQGAKIATQTENEERHYIGHRRMTGIKIAALGIACGLALWYGGEGLVDVLGGLGAVCEAQISSGTKIARSVTTMTDNLTSIISKEDKQRYTAELVSVVKNQAHAIKLIPYSQADNEGTGYINSELIDILKIDYGLSGKYENDPKITDSNNQKNPKKVLEEALKDVLKKMGLKLTGPEEEKHAETLAQGFYRVLMGAVADVSTDEARLRYAREKITTNVEDERLKTLYHTPAYSVSWYRNVAALMTNSWWSSDPAKNEAITKFRDRYLTQGENRTKLCEQINQVIQERKDEYRKILNARASSGL